jgi:hypothetical protein
MKKRTLEKKPLFHKDEVILYSILFIFGTFFSYQACRIYVTLTGWQIESEFFKILIGFLLLGHIGISLLVDLDNKIDRRETKPIWTIRTGIVLMIPVLFNLKNFIAGFGKPPANDLFACLIIMAVAYLWLFVKNWISVWYSSAIKNKKINEHPN